ncbi:N-acetylmuramoyl-L-alanine amidase [Rhodoplanes sp. TEM]|uniref:N-acetylmuramoyl-L-alanine amidase n=1 Tax=Rhodoplanes tepidamans TaxID=200616 RepID=A0ABT5J6Y6_RHOTP|nr:MULTISPECIES: N-acetylmuramoyl-L-alanine amidase [Rhodoplanes]MDC7785366.1 N-acetylmuramoyl-L-alanine amidase [Rhodoplanes tepidamans]MDC7984324.1 N-acetylmuramoyl-L-alanine amidase [Rhodoplanes sp. TEM]MDQ0353182.1 N-acetylmuramoyl-L-alanine amidase [Rhodoplanes tepidamans]
MPVPSADSPLVAEIHPSPSHESRAAGRRGGRPDILLLHYTGMVSTVEALARLCDPAAKVSCHYLVREDGTVVQMVAEARRAWHAGVSCWAGDTDVNSRAIGIEIANAGHDFGCPPFPPVQIEAVTALCRDILARHRIPADRVLAHSDVAPDRKRDPGEIFPWDALAGAGVGLWGPPAPLDTPGPALAPGDEGQAVAALQAGLAGFGYAVPRDGAYGGPTALVVAAFQRHFRPARVDGIADASTVATLQRIIEKKDSLVEPDTDRVVG